MLVSVVLVNFNSGELGAMAAASVRRQVGVDVELIVVDNASVDDSLAQIEQAAVPEVVLRLDENVGYAAAVNLGYRAASGAFVLPLNCDAELGETYAAIAVEVMSRDATIGVVGGAVVTGDGHRRGPLKVGATMRVTELPATEAVACRRVDGACAVWRRTAIDEVVERSGVGPLDEVFFVYGETVDLAFKLEKLGWRTWFEPTMVATHVRSFTSAVRVADKRGPLRQMVLASRHVNLARHGVGWRKPLLRGVLVAQDVAFVGRQLVRNDRSVPTDVLGAWRRAHRMLGGDLPIERASGQRPTPT